MNYLFELMQLIDKTKKIEDFSETAKIIALEVEDNCITSNDFILLSGLIVAKSEVLKAVQVRDEEIKARLS